MARKLHCKEILSFIGNIFDVWSLMFVCDWVGSYYSQKYIHEVDWRCWIECVGKWYVCVCMRACCGGLVNCPWIQLVTAGISPPRLCIHTKGGYAELTFHFVIKVIPFGHRVTSCSQLGPIFQQNPGVRDHSLLWRVVAQTYLIDSFYSLYLPRHSHNRC